MAPLLGNPQICCIDHDVAGNAIAAVVFETKIEVVVVSVSASKVVNRSLVVSVTGLIVVVVSVCASEVVVVELVDLVVGVAGCRESRESKHVCVVLV